MIFHLFYIHLITAQIRYYVYYTIIIIEYLLEIHMTISCDVEID